MTLLVFEVDPWSWRFFSTVSYITADVVQILKILLIWLRNILLSLVSNHSSGVLRNNLASIWLQFSFGNHLAYLLICGVDQLDNWILIRLNLLFLISLPIKMPVSPQIYFLLLTNQLIWYILGLLIIFFAPGWPRPDLIDINWPTIPWIISTFCSISAHI